MLMISGPNNAQLLTLANNQLIYVRYGTGITVHIVISLKHTREYGTIRTFVVRTVYEITSS